MDAFINVIQVAVCTAYFAICIRLVRLSLRSGEAPERFLGVAFLFWGLSYVLYYPPYYLLAEGSLQSICFFFSGVADDVGAFSLALVTRCVFRKRERWAKFLVAGIAVFLIAGVGGSVWVGEWEGNYPLSNPWFWLEVSGDAATMIWIAIEGLQNYRKARQRLRLGLCEPLVCNRYLLWGLSGAIWILYDLALIAQYIDFELTQLWSPTLDILVSFLGASAVAVIWFVFFPPTFYRNWIDNFAAVADVAEEGGPDGD
jgi:hypothetical protein